MFEEVGSSVPAELRGRCLHGRPGSLWEPAALTATCSGHSAQWPPSPIPAPLAPFSSHQQRLCWDHSLAPPPRALERRLPWSPDAQMQALRPPRTPSGGPLQGRVQGDVQSQLGIIRMYAGLGAIPPAWPDSLLAPIRI